MAKMNCYMNDYDDQIVRLMDTYLRYRGIDKVLGKSISRNAFESLEKIGLEAVIAVAQKMLTHSEAELRCQGAEMLLLHTPDSGLPAVILLLQDTHSGVRSFVCGLIHDFGDERAANPIIDLLLREQDGTVRHHAAYALGAVGTADKIPVITEIAEKETAVDWEGRSVQQELHEAVARIASRCK